jgi:DUF917 family protein
MFKISSIHEIEDLVRGAAVLATGGGGSPTEGLKMLEEALRIKGEINFIDVDEVPENWIVAVPYQVGTMAPLAKTRKIVKISDPMPSAFKELERILNKKINAVLPGEIGGGNTSVAINIGARMGLPVIDGDLIGRAAPEIIQASQHIFDVPLYPSVLVSETGNILIIKKYADMEDYEAIARFLSILSGRFVAVVDTPLVKEDLKKVVIKNTISECIKIGRVIREARESNRDPVEAIVKVMSGWKIFEGIVKSYTWKNEGGFLIGEALLEGVNEWQGHELKSWIKNEHIIAWRNNKPIVMPPDLMTFLLDNGEAVINDDLKKGMKIQVVAAKAPEVWRTPKGLELFGPKHFGFDLEYVPVEKLIKQPL